MKEYSSPNDALRERFLRSLATDLRRIGHSATYAKGKQVHRLKFAAKDLAALSAEARKDYIRDLADREKRETWRRNAKFIAKVESARRQELFPDSAEVDIRLIRPTVHIVRSDADRELLRYCRIYQGLTESSGAGRRFGALVYDTGQKKRYLIGALSLADPGLALKARDEFLEWHKIDSRTTADAVRTAGLRRMMHISVAIALPPYNLLRAGKLLATLAFSDPMQGEFRRRYKGEPMLALATTSVFGPVAAPFHRIRPKDFPKYLLGDAPDRTNLFDHVGDTEGYTTTFFSEACFESARALVNLSSRRPGEVRGMHSDRTRDAYIKNALSICGVSREVLKLMPKGILVGALHSKNLAALQTEKRSEVIVDLPADVAALYWKERWLPNALNSPDVVNELKVFDGSKATIASLLGGKG